MCAKPARYHGVQRIDWLTHDDLPLPVIGNAHVIPAMETTFAKWVMHGMPTCWFRAGKQVQLHHKDSTILKPAYTGHIRDRVTTYAEWLLPHTVRAHHGTLQRLHALRHKFIFIHKCRKGSLQLLQALIIQHPVGCYHCKACAELSHQYVLRAPAVIIQTCQRLAPHCMTPNMLKSFQQTPCTVPWSVHLAAVYHSLCKLVSLRVCSCTPAERYSCTTAVTTCWLKQYHCGCPSTTSGDNPRWHSHQPCSRYVPQTWQLWQW